MSDIKRKCVTCTKNGGILKCNGCEQVFCNTHATEHRQNLAVELDYIMQENDSIQHEIQQMSVDHALFRQIDQWEKDSIAKIQTAAVNARKTLEKLINQSKENLSKTCHDLGADLISSLNAEDYLETDFERWTEQLNRLKSEVVWPSSVNIIENKKPGVHLIRVESNELNKNELSSNKLKLPTPASLQQLPPPTPPPPPQQQQQVPPTAPPQQQQQVPPTAPPQQLPSSAPQQQVPSVALSQQQQLPSPSPPPPPSLVQQQKEKKKQEQTPPVKVELPKKIQGKFLDIYGPGRLENEDRIARHIGSIYEYSYIRGNLLYHKGQHSIRIRIEKCGQPYNIFFGCMSSKTTVIENIFKLPSVLGWFGLDRVYDHGVCRSNRKKYKYNSSLIKEKHVLQITFDCNRSEMILCNETANTKNVLPVNINHAPLPWQLLVVMNYVDDRVRILDDL